LFTPPKRPSYKKERKKIKKKLSLKTLSPLFVGGPSKLPYLTTTKISQRIKLAPNNITSLHTSPGPLFMKNPFF